MRDFLHRLGQPWREATPIFVLFLVALTLGGGIAYLIGRGA